MNAPVPPRTLKTGALPGQFRSARLAEGRLPLYHTLAQTRDDRLMLRKLTLLASATGALAFPALGAPIMGFTPATSEAERALEARFDQSLSAQAIRERLKVMSSAPNHVGSPHDRENAEYVLARFKEWGWDAHIETFDVLYPTPKRESLELVTPNRFQATLTEPAVAGDSTSGHQDGGLPAWFAYGGEGDVTAPLVYVNYGMPADYEALRRLGVDVKGKIVIARYGVGWRGLKPKLAYEHGVGRLHRLFRPGRRRLRHGRALAQGSGASRARLPARFDPGPACRAGRPAHAGLRLNGRRQAHRPCRRQEHPQDPGPADLLGRRPGVPEKPRWSSGAEELPRVPPHHLSRGRRRGAPARIWWCSPTGIRSRSTT